MPTERIAAPLTLGVSHIAVSVAAGTLTQAWRDEFLRFYGGWFGWSEIDNRPRPDRFTVATGGACYLNVREREHPMECTGYEHFGMVVESTQRVEELYAQLSPLREDIRLADLIRNDDGTRSFRFRYLLPLAMEVQYFPPGAVDESPRRWGRTTAHL